MLPSNNPSRQPPFKPTMSQLRRQQKMLSQNEPGIKKEENKAPTTLKTPEKPSKIPVIPSIQQDMSPADPRLTRSKLGLAQCQVENLNPWIVLKVKIPFLTSPEPSKEIKEAKQEPRDPSTSPGEPRLGNSVTMTPSSPSVPLVVRNPLRLKISPLTEVPVVPLTQAANKTNPSPPPTIDPRASRASFKPPSFNQLRKILNENQTKTQNIQKPSVLLPAKLASPAMARKTMPLKPIRLDEAPLATVTSPIFSSRSSQNPLFFPDESGDIADLVTRPPPPILRGQPRGTVPMTMYPTSTSRINGSEKRVIKVPKRYFMDVNGLPKPMDPSRVRTPLRGNAPVNSLNCRLQLGPSMDPSVLPEIKDPASYSNPIQTEPAATVVQDSTQEAQTSNPRTIATPVTPKSSRFYVGKLKASGLRLAETGPSAPVAILDRRCELTPIRPISQRLEEDGIENQEAPEDKDARSVALDTAPDDDSVPVLTKKVKKQDSSTIQMVPSPGPSGRPQRSKMEQASPEQAKLDINLEGEPETVIKRSKDPVQSITLSDRQIKRAFRRSNRDDEFTVEGQPRPIRIPNIQFTRVYYLKLARSSEEPRTSESSVMVDNGYYSNHECHLMEDEIVEMIYADRVYEVANVSYTLKFLVPNEELSVKECLEKVGLRLKEHGTKRPHEQVPSEIYNETPLKQLKLAQPDHPEIELIDLTLDDSDEEYLEAVPRKNPNSIFDLCEGQLEELWKGFEENENPRSDFIENLATKLNLTEKMVTRWFKTERMKKQKILQAEARRSPPASRTRAKTNSPMGIQRMIEENEMIEKRGFKMANISNKKSEKLIPTMTEAEMIKELLEGAAKPREEEVAPEPDILVEEPVEEACQETDVVQMEEMVPIAVEDPVVPIETIIQMDPAIKMNWVPTVQLDSVVPTAYTAPEVEDPPPASTVTNADSNSNPYNPIESNDINNGELIFSKEQLNEMVKDHTTRIAIAQVLIYCLGNGGEQFDMENPLLAPLKNIDLAQFKESQEPMEVDEFTINKGF